jgi:hypothetical protein
MAQLQRSGKKTLFLPQIDTRIIGRLRYTAFRGTEENQEEP